MFGRTNNNKNQQPAAKDENVREESRFENNLNSVQPMGNEAVGGMPPQLPPNIGNETVNGILNDHYAENMLQFPKLSKGRQMDESIEQALDLQTRIAGKPKKKQKPSGRNAGKRSAPFKANAPMQDLASPGQKLGSAGNLNVEDLLRKQQEEKDKFRIIERPHDNNSIIENMDDDEGGRFIKTKDEENNRSGTSIRNGGLKLLSVAEEDQKRPVKKSQSGGMRERYDDEDENEIISEYFDDDKKKTERKSIQKANLNISADDLFASYIEEEDRFRDEEDEEKEEEPVQEEKNKEDNSEYDDYALEEDMRPSASAKNNVKNRRNKTKKKKGVKARELGKDEINNLQGIDQNYWKDPAIERLKKIQANDKNAEQKKDFYAEEMERIKNWDFHAEKLDEVKSPSKLSKFLTWVATGAGKLFGGLVSTLTMSGLWRARSSLRAGLKDKDSWQQETDHQTIPGWEGEKYDPNATKGEDVMADFRRVPTVWSYLTAGKAAEKKIENGQEVEKPLDPVVSVLVDQPKSGSSQSMDGSNMGHAMLGIEYSRKSLISNRYERYKIQYGFYPAALLPSASALMMKDNAVIPGQLIDDHDHTYDVSRSYPAKPSQVNAIFQASEKYADGGYGFYDRNCATFVKEMVVNKARLATGGDIFERTEVEFSNLANAVMMGAEASDENVKAGTENMFLDFSEQDDESYLKYGNKKATYRDLQNYKNSLNKGSNWTKKTYVPGRLAERMRRMEGEGTGEIGTRKYSEGLRDEKGNLVLTLGRLYKSIGNKTADISEKLTIIFPPGQNQQIPLELRDLIIEINGAAEPIEMINEKIAENLAKKNEGKKEEDIIKQEDIDEEYYIGPDELRTARQDLSESISKVNIILNNYLKNDKRIHNEMMDLISLLNYAVEYMDDLYRKTARGGRSDGKNPDNIREKMTQQEFTVKEDGQTAKFTPSHYESYIQIYKDPKIAVAKYNRLKELKQKKEEHGDWAGDDRLVLMMHKAKSALHMEDRDELTFEEYKELEKLEKMDDLADQFDNAHNYMLEKEQYSQKDIDYAFQLSYREKFGNRKGQSEARNADNADDFRYNYYSASGIYISLFLDKIFHGLKEEWMKGPEQGGLSMDDINSTAGARGWIDDFFTKRVKSKKNEFQMILLGLSRAMRAADPKGNITYAKVLEKVSDMMINTLVTHNFDINSNDMREAMGEAQLTNYLSMVGDEKSFKFSGMLNSMIAACLKEVRKADLPKDRMN